MRMFLIVMIALFTIGSFAKDVVKEAKQDIQMIQDIDKMASYESDDNYYNELIVARNNIAENVNRRIELMDEKSFKHNLKPVKIIPIRETNGTRAK